MAVLLGFVDELITENYLDKVDYTTNKLGGFPVSLNLPITFYFVYVDILPELIIIIILHSIHLKCS